MHLELCIKVICMALGFLRTSQVGGLTRLRPVGNRRFLVLLTLTPRYPSGESFFPIQSSTSVTIAVRHQVCKLLILYNINNNTFKGSLSFPCFLINFLLKKCIFFY